MPVRNLFSRIFGSKPSATPQESPKFRRPSRTQRQICERLGVPIPADMDSRSVHALIQEAVRDPQKKALFDAYERERAAEAEREEREELGDELFEIVKPWEALSDAGGQYLARFKRGKTEHVDVVEFDPLDLDPSRARSPVKVCLLLPKRRTERDTDAYLEWEREVALTPEQILSLEKLPQEIDMFDIAAYEAVLAKATNGQAGAPRSPTSR